MARFLNSNVYKQTLTNMAKEIIYNDNIILDYGDGTFLAFVMNEDGEPTDKECKSLDEAKAWIDEWV